jgi:hypothetical protein
MVKSQSPAFVSHLVASLIHWQVYMKYTETTNSHVIWPTIMHAWLSLVVASYKKSHLA